MNYVQYLAFTIVCLSYNLCLCLYSCALALFSLTRFGFHQLCLFFNYILYGHLDVSLMKLAGCHQILPE